VIDDTAFAGSWDTVTGIAPSKNAVYDKIAAMDITIAAKANSSALAGYLPLTGGTLTGTLNVAPASGPANVFITAASTYQPTLTLTGMDPRIVLNGNDVNSYYPALAMSAQNGAITTSIMPYGGMLYDANVGSHWFRINGVQVAAFNVNGLAVTGNVRANSPTAGWGSLELATGNASNSGYIAFYDPSGARSGYIGNSSSTKVVAVTEGSRIWQFQATSYDFQNAADTVHFATIDSTGINLPTGLTYKVNGVPIGGGTADGLGPDGDKGDVAVGGGGTTLTVQSAAGDFTANGAILLPTATASPGNVTASAHIYYSAGSGLVLKGAGTTYDVTIASRNSALIMTVDSLNVCKFWVAPYVSDLAYSAAWDGDLRVPTRNAVYDKIESVIASIPAAPSTVIDDTAYAGSWDGVTTIAPSKNAVYDKIQAVIATIPAATTSIVGITGTIAQFNTAVTDADLATTAMLGTAAAKNISVGTSAPGSPAVNDLWVDTT